MQSFTPPRMVVLSPQAACADLALASSASRSASGAGDGASPATATLFRRRRFSRPATSTFRPTAPSLAPLASASLLPSMVAPLSRPLLRVPRASSSRLPAAAQRRLFSSSRPSLAETEQPSSASSAEQASSSPSAAPTADKPAPFVWTPSLQWAFDTTKPVGKLFNAAGTKVRPGATSSWCRASSALDRRPASDLTALVLSSLVRLPTCRRPSRITTRTCSRASTPPPRR